MVDKWSKRSRRKGWVEVDSRTGDVHVWYPYDKQRNVELVKLVGAENREWNDKKRNWIFRGKVGKSILSWAEKNGLDGVTDAVYELQTFEAEQQKRKLCRTVDLSDVPINAKLRPYQISDIAFTRSVLEREGSAGNFNSPGLGKTLESIALCEWGNYFPACILTPQIVKAQFDEEIHRFTPHRKTVILTGEKPYALPAADYYIINPDILQHWLPVLQAMGFAIVVADESTYYKSLDSIRERALKALNATAKYSVIMTGTPVENKFQDMMGQLDVLGRLDRDWGGKEKFLRYFTKVTEIQKPVIMKDKMNKTIKDKNGKPRYRTETVLEPGETQNLSEFYNYLTRWSVRHRKEEVLTELPPIQRTMYKIPMKGAHKKEYLEAENNFLAWLAATEGADAAHRASRAEKLIRMGKLNRLAARGIVDDVAGWIKTITEDDDEKLIVYAWNKEIVTQLATRFSAPFINGDATPKQKDEARKRFTTDPNCNLLIINFKSGGVGLNLMGTVDKTGERKQCSRVAFIQYPWSPGDVMQSESRLHRMGQEMPVDAYWFVAENTIHQYMVESLQAKQLIATEAVDGMAEQFDITDDVAAAMLKRKVG